MTILTTWQKAKVITPTHPSGMMEVIGDKMVDDVGAVISYLSEVEWTMADSFGKICSRPSSVSGVEVVCPIA